MSRRITNDFIQELAKEIKLKKRQKNLDRKQLFCGNKSKYKRLKVEVDKPNRQWQMDLMDMTFLQRYNSGIRYLLIVIDVFSRFVWVRKLRNKNSNHVLNKFEGIMKEENVLPDVIHSDKGGEFSEIKRKSKNGSFGKMIKYRSNENYEMKSVMVERFIRTLRMMISNVLYGLYGKTEGRYTNVLDKIIEKYNETPHKGVDNNKPIDVYYGNAKISRVFKYKRYFEFYPFYKKGMILKEGQRVRVAQLKSRFQKESTFKWSKEIFMIEKVRLTNPVTYVIRDVNNEILSGVFYREELLKI